MKIVVAPKEQMTHLHFLQDGFEEIAQKVKYFYPNEHPIIMADERVAHLYYKSIQGPFLDLGINPIWILHPSGEGSKSIQGYQRLLELLDRQDIHRRRPIIALGGGVTGDLVGFVAATMLRGMPLIQVPTTLLSMIDSSIGGKVAINTPLGKNRAGAFYPPEHVFFALEFLQTLEAADLHSGFGELLKHAILDGEEHFAWLRRNVLNCCSEKTVLEREDLLTLLQEEMIKKSLAVKQRIVEEDPFEKGRRALLNLGHTVGHAIEGVLGMGKGWSHGGCVALGLLAELSWSVEHLGLCSSEIDRIEQTMIRLGMNTQVPNISRAELLAFMNSDKKRTVNHLRFVGMADFGEAKVVELPIQKGSELLNHLERWIIRAP
ncbi:MAG: 3-dehydroquinate synthase [Proteobacteria bacterium]|nr:3-dehydroquinate synthase [Pseudomonadota bacterium]